MQNEKFHNLCIKSIAGEISSAEQKELEHWLNASAENRSGYQEIQQIWQKAEIISIAGNLQIDEQWERLSRDLGLMHAEKHRKLSPASSGIRVRMKRFFKPGLRPAYAIVGVAIIVLIALVSIQKQEVIPVLQEIVTNNGETTECMFSDGSTVRLNSGSSIQFSSVFSDTARQVFLKGEGFFAIAKENRPFVVNTESAKTVVLGTEFNVWARGSETRVIVKSGIVRFLSLKNKEDVVLLENQMSCLDEKAAPTSPKTVDADFLLGWLKGRLVFERTPILEIIAELERRYNISIVMDNVDVKNETITASFDSSSLETIFASLCLTLGIQYKIEQARVTLFKTL
ncbi:MAG: FecR family protein [Candidatus Zhuqueibacterota bacterium]